MTSLDQDFYTELGRILQDARLSKKLSYDSLSKKINYIKTKSTLKRYEAGDSHIEAGILTILCDALGLDANETLKMARDRAVYGQSKYNDLLCKSDKEYLEHASLDKLLNDTGYSIGFDAENAFMWIDYPDGSLEVTQDMLIELYRDVNVFLKFRLSDLKEKHIAEFKKYKK